MKRAVPILLVLPLAGCLAMGRPIPAIAVDPIPGLPAGDKRTSASRSVTVVTEFDVASLAQDALGGKGDAISDATLVLRSGAFSATLCIEGRRIALPPHDDDR